MPRIIRRARARDDVLDHWSDLAVMLDTARADALIERLATRLQTLAEHPESGVLRNALRPGLRSVVFETLVVFYHPIRDGIELVRVLDGSRDLDVIPDDEP